MAFKTQSKKQLRKQAKRAQKQAKKAGKQVAAREDAVRNLFDNQELHDDLRQLAEAAKTAYTRVAGTGPQALLQDKKVHSELRNASGALLDAKKSLAKPAKKKKKRGFFRLLVLGTIGSAVAVATVPALRGKALDLVFGPEEELDYSVGTPAPAGAGAQSANGSAASAAAASAASNN